MPSFFHVTERARAEDQRDYGISPNCAYRLPSSDDNADIELFPTLESATEAVQKAQESGAGDLEIIEVDLPRGAELLYEMSPMVYGSYEVGGRAPSDRSFHFEARIEADRIVGIHPGHRVEQRVGLSSW